MAKFSVEQFPRPAGGIAYTGRLFHFMSQINFMVKSLLRIVEIIYFISEISYLHLICYCGIAISFSILRIVGIDRSKVLG